MFAKTAKRSIASLGAVAFGATVGASDFSYSCNPTDGVVTTFVGEKEVTQEVALGDIKIPEPVIIGGGVIKGRVIVQGNSITFKGFYNAQMSKSFNANVFTHIERDREQDLTTRYDAIQIKQNPSTGKIEIAVRAQRGENSHDASSVNVFMVCPP